MGPEIADLLLAANMGVDALLAGHARVRGSGHARLSQRVASRSASNVDNCRNYSSSMLPEPTARLRFREMTEADLPAISTLEIGGSRGPEGWIEWTRRNYERYGFGLWVIETPGGEFVGDCGLTMQDVEGEELVEAGWHVRSPLRRQGFAAEAAASVRDAAREAGVEHLVAIIRPTNIASQRVATKIGMALEREVHAHGGPALVFGADFRSKSELPATVMP